LGQDKIDCKVIGRVGTSTITNKKRKHPRGEEQKAEEIRLSFIREAVR
jgi:hypothetical protein